MNLFDLAEAVSLFYGQDQARAALEELKDVAEDYRVINKSKGQVEWFTYVLRLLLACPILLERPPGLEWVTDDLKWALQRRKWHAQVEQDFWKAVGKVRALVTTGRPGKKDRDLLRVLQVTGLMNPVYPGPDGRLVRTKGLSKAAAISRVAEIEGEWTGRSPDPKEIHRSLERFEDYRERISGQLEYAKKAHGQARKKR